MKREVKTTLVILGMTAIVIFMMLVAGRLRGDTYMRQVEKRTGIIRYEF